MVKKIITPIDIQIRVDTQEEDITIDVSAHYGRESEGLTDRRGLPIILSADDEKAIKKLIKNIIYPKMKEAESISEKKFSWEV